MPDQRRDQEAVRVLPRCRRTGALLHNPDSAKERTWPTSLPERCDHERVSSGETDFLAALRARFDAEGTNVLVDWDQHDEMRRMMLYGPCWCGRAYASRSIWTLDPDGRIGGQIDCICPSGHSMDDEVIPVPDVSSWKEGDDDR